MDESYSFIWQPWVFINNLGDVTALDVNNGSLVWQTPTQSSLIYQDAFSLENSDLVFENNIATQLNNPYVSKSLFLMDDFSNIMEEFYITLNLNEIFEDLKILL